MDQTGGKADFQGTELDWSTNPIGVVPLGGRREACRQAVIHANMHDIN